MLIQEGASPEAVLQGAQHILFVEGTKDGLDVTVLNELVTPKLRVAPLGPSYSVRSVATALHANHPYYWFLIDRDDWDDQAIEKSWRSFPDPSADNLLIWRRKELESYFLEPDWVCQSQYAQPKATPAALKAWLAKEASRVLLLEAANRVLIAKRNAVKRTRVSLFASKDLQGLTRAQVADKLVASPLIANLANSAALSEPDLRAAFDRELSLLSDDVVPLKWGRGRWRDLIDAKALFSTLVNQWFAVPDLAKGGSAHLKGRDAERAVAVELLKHHPTAMPGDFTELRTMLERVTK